MERAFHRPRTNVIAYHCFAFYSQPNDSGKAVGSRYNRWSHLSDLDVFQGEVFLGPQRSRTSPLHLQRTNRFLRVHQSAS